MKRQIFLFAAVIATTLTTTPAHAQSDPGAYLAARQAAMNRDFQAAARYYTQTLLSDPSNPQLLEDALTSYIALGQFSRAEPISDQMVELDVRSQMAAIAQFAGSANRGAWSEIFDSLEAGLTVSPLVDGLLQGWAALGNGDMTQAIKNFDASMESAQTSTFGAYHKALALAAVGDFEAADAIFAAPADGQAFSARAAIAHAQTLSQLDRNDDALEMLSAVFGRSRNPGIQALRKSLEAGERVPYDIATDAKQGMGEVFFMVSELLRGDTPDAYILQYTRTAEYLDPTHSEAILASARLLEQLERYELANETYAKIAPEHPAYVEAELGRVDVLRNADRDDAAAEVAAALARAHPNMAAVHAKLGDVYRGLERDQEAVDAYTQALALFNEADTARWLVHYTRAITYHRMDIWPNAEEDFRAALDLNPDQPQVLNYLGYSLVERKEKLEEAFTMIETAVAAQPNNGAIVDSLAWVLFQTGRYEESVAYMERAVSLEATDPIVTDHLGDVYWAVGRDNEAVFQWNRALSFEPDEELADRIRMKLEVGLDAVLESEGLDPIRMADDDS